MSEHEIKLGDGRSIPLDEKGYLLEPSDWVGEVAEIMADADGIDLSEDHWLVIDIFQQYFREFDIEPPMRALVRIAKERMDEERGNSRYLYRLFPNGPTLQASRYAGLPRPLSCI